MEESFSQTSQTTCIVCRCMCSSYLHTCLINVQVGLFEMSHLWNPTFDFWLSTFMISKSCCFYHLSSIRFWNIKDHFDWIDTLLPLSFLQDKIYIIFLVWMILQKKKLFSHLPSMIFILGAELEHVIIPSMVNQLNLV